VFPFAVVGPDRGLAKLNQFQPSAPAPGNTEGPEPPPWAEPITIVAFEPGTFVAPAPSEVLVVSAPSEVPAGWSGVSAMYETHGCEIEVPARLEPVPPTDAGGEPEGAANGPDGSAGERTANRGSDVGAEASSVSSDPAPESRKRDSSHSTASRNRG
jgi:hypothetical protein